MSPEQAKAEAVDQRADLYAFGLILRDMLLGGRMPGNTSGVSELMGRMQQTPPGLRSIDPAIPEALESLVTRCLQPNATGSVIRLRPSSFATSTASRLAGRRRLRRSRQERLARLAGAAVGDSRRQPADRSRVGRLGVARAVEASAPPQQVRPRGPVITVAILPFRNASGDPTLDSLGPSLSQVLSTTLGQSASVRTVPPDRMHQVLRDLQIGSNATLAPTQLASVADFTSARHVLWGR